LLIFLISVLVGLVAANLPSIVALFVTALILFGFVAGNMYLLYYHGLQFSLTTPFLAGMVPFMVGTAYRVAVEQRQARALQGALASVIPAEVAHEIARDPDRVKMGGERRVISVLFTDLKNFTGFSESVSPDLLSRVITEYLNAMVEIVFKHGGTVDKFIGDAIMAFWNAPLDVPDHAYRACAAALEMQARLAKLGDKWEAEGLPRHFMRVGINTGPVSVGNMGTSQRFSYTALGDTVNLGARLEPLNNEYGTSVCISQATFDEAGGREKFLVRFLDLVAVKGKTEPVPVYELIGKSEDAVLYEQYRPILEPYHRAMVLYQARQFDQAYTLFHRAMEATGNGPDAPSAVYVERCEELSKAPPVSDWDGVYVMHHK
jgi:adenylate cyclase